MSKPTDAQLNGGGRSLQREAVLFPLARRAAFSSRGAKAAARMGLGLHVVADDKHHVGHDDDEREVSE